MKFIYNIGIYALGFSIRLASLFSSKARLWILGRRDVYINLPQMKDRQVIWFHCASLGEFDQGLPLMEKLKERNPTIFILVTFFSPSGMQHYHKRKHCADHVMYLPLDTRKNARNFFERIQPSQAFFVKYEFWSNFIFEAKRNDVKLYNVSGIFRENHRYFKWYGNYFRKTLKAFDWFFVQNKSSLELLKTIGIVNVSISGDSRFDRVLENKKFVVKNEMLEEFTQNSKVFIVGSSWPEDERIIQSFVQKGNQKTLIAPHNIDEGHIQSLLKQFPEAVRFTQTNPEEIARKRILILDTIGQLSNAYSYGNLAYVGGGFSGNLHNILEPAVFGLPVIFGPKHSRFPEAQMFIDKGIGISVSNESEFELAFRSIYDDLTLLSQKTTEFVEENKGASEKIIVKLTANSTT